jgi:predicted PurR-regulated permease PerM
MLVANLDAPKEARDRSLLRRLGIGVLAGAGGFFLLRAMGEFLQPVLIALLFCFALWPLHAWLKRQMHPGLSLLLFGTGLAIVPSSSAGWSSPTLNSSGKTCRNRRYAPDGSSSD